MKVTIRYNVQIGDFKVIERHETFHAISMWKAEGTSLVYFKTDRFNVRAIAESEIVEVVE